MGGHLVEKYSSLFTSLDGSRGPTVHFNAGKGVFAFGIAVSIGFVIRNTL